MGNIYLSLSVPQGFICELCPDRTRQAEILFPFSVRQAQVVLVRSQRKPMVHVRYLFLLLLWGGGGGGGTLTASPCAVSIYGT